MAYIKIDFQRLSQLETQLRGLPGKISSAAENAANVRSGLDWDVACEERIDARLQNAANKLEECKTRMDKTVIFLSNTAADYQKAEELCAESEEERIARLKAEGEALMKQVEQMEINNARDDAILLDDPISRYLADQRAKNERFSIQAASYGYDIASFKWLDAIKKGVPGSEAVDEARKIAIQKAYASIVGSEPPMYSQDEFGQKLCEFTTDGASELNGLLAEDGSGIFSVLGAAVETGFDVNQYKQWSAAQQQVFYDSLNSSAENLKLLNELKTAFPDDAVMVEYCNDMIKDIEAFTNGSNLDKFINSLGNAGEAVGDTWAIGLKNAGEAAADFVVPEIISQTVSKGNVVTAVGSGAGYVAELAFGTGTTAETFENVDIMYTNIECSVNAYNQAVNSGQLSATAQRFQELNILNQKMAALEMTTSLNQTFGRKNEKLVEGVNSMVNSLQYSYDVLAQQ